ncbi:uncharacterized protein DFL_004475 [Arthrobotrys flagrans]|uniref:Uncharacterized protein n=1 Tax=Arthrobotrys flagrans TaxID=97331 RepID=A0A437A4Y8_ARTFL|nr:hypothetical protein DFL_004475 [Arthrobotrys flagrans]
MALVSKFRILGLFLVYGSVALGHVLYERDEGRETTVQGKKITTTPLLDEHTRGYLPQKYTEQESSGKKHLRVRAPSEAPLLGEPDAPTRYDMIRGISTLRVEKEDMYIDPDYPGLSESYCNSAIVSTTVSAIKRFNGVSQYAADFFESIERSEIITDKGHYYGYEVSPNDEGPSLACSYSAKDRNLIAIPTLPDFRDPKSDFPRDIYRCWHYASRAGSDDLGWLPESPRYVTIHNIPDAYGLSAIKRLAKLWDENKMYTMSKGRGLSVSRADVNPELAEKEPEEYKNLNIYDAAWALLHQPWQTFGIIEFLGAYQYGLSRLQISNIRFALYDRDNKLASKSDLDSNPNAIAYATVFFELERRPAAPSNENPDDENTASPPGGGDFPDEVMEDVDVEGLLRSPVVDEDIIMGEAPSRLGSPIPALQIATWVSRPELPPGIHPLGPDWVRRHAETAEHPLSYLQLSNQYTTDIFFTAYASRLEQHLVLFSTITTARPPEMALPPPQLANVIRSAWLHSAGGTMLRGITLGNLLPKTLGILEEVRERWGRGSAPRSMSEDSFGAGTHDSNRERFNSILGRLAETWEGASILHLTALDEGILGINHILSVKYGRPLRLSENIDEDAKFLVFEFSNELPVSSDNTIEAGPSNPSGQEDTTSSPDLADLVVLAFEQGARSRVKYSKPYMPAGNSEESYMGRGPVGSRLIRLKRKYFRKSLTEIKAHKPNKLLSHEQTVAHIQLLLQDSVFQKDDFLTDAYPDFEAKVTDIGRKIELSTYELDIFGSTKDELEANDERLPHFAWSGDLGHLVIVQQPDSEWSASRSFDLKDMFVIETITTERKVQPSDPIFPMGTSPIRLFSFLDIQQDSRRILSYISGRLFGSQMPGPFVLMHKSNPFYVPPKTKVHIKDEFIKRLAWLIVLGLPEVRAVLEYAAEINYFMNPDRESRYIWPDSINTMIIQWVRRNNDEGDPQDLIPEIFIQLSISTRQNSAFWGKGKSALFTEEPTIQDHLQAGEPLEMQEVYRPSLPKPVRQNGFLVQEWLCRVDPERYQVSTRNPATWKFLDTAFWNWERKTGVAEQQAFKLEIESKTLVKVHISNARQRLEYEALVEPRGRLMIFQDGIPAPGKPIEGIKALAPAVYLIWDAAVKSYNTMGEDGQRMRKIEPPQYVVIMKVCDRTARLIRVLWSKYGKRFAPNKFYARSNNISLTLLSRALEIQGKDGEDIHSVRGSTESEIFFTTLLGTPEVGSILQAFQNYQSEMGTWRAYIAGIYLKWENDANARDGKIMIMLQNGERGKTPIQNPPNSKDTSGKGPFKFINYYSGP